MTAEWPRLDPQWLEDRVSPAQRDAWRSLWERALARAPALRRPAVGVSADRALEASWSFEDVPGRVFAIEIDRDGVVEWFYRASSTEPALGSGDEAARELPDDALELLVRGVGQSASAGVPGR